MKDKTKELNKSSDNQKEEITINPASIDDNIKDEVKEIKESIK